MLEITKLYSQFFDENTYIVSDDGSSCYIIDPSADFASIKKVISAKYSQIKGILLTHGHLDHYFTVNQLVGTYKAKVYLSQSDIPLTNGEQVLDENFKNSKYHLTYPTFDSVYDFNDHNVTVIPTPGHSKGSVCYYFSSAHIIFTGDTLFHENYGRTDLFGGSLKELKMSLNTLFKLPPETVVYPGHGPKTTIKHEIDFNFGLK